MTKASEIVVRAFREINLKAIGKPLTAPEAAEGLTLLNSYLSSLFSLEIGEPNFSWPVAPATTSPTPARFPLFPAVEDLPDDVFPFPPSNVNILITLAQDTTIFLNQDPEDGAQMRFINLMGATTLKLIVDGNGRFVKGVPILSQTADTIDKTRLFYRADLGDWTEIIKLTDDTESPLQEEYDTLLSIGTAARLAAAFGRTLSGEQVAERKRLLTKLKTQYKQKTPSPASPQPFSKPASDDRTFSHRRSLFR